MEVKDYLKEQQPVIDNWISDGLDKDKIEATGGIGEWVQLTLNKFLANK